MELAIKNMPASRAAVSPTRQILLGQGPRDPGQPKPLVPKLKPVDPDANIDLENPIISPLAPTMIKLPGKTVPLQQLSTPNNESNKDQLSNDPANTKLIDHHDLDVLDNIKASMNPEQKE